MGEAALELDTQETLRNYQQESAVVVAASERDWIVRTRSGSRLAKRAASCLVVPEPGDEVLLASSDDGAETFVLAILRRANPERVASVSVDGNLRLRAGHVEIAAEDGIRMLTPADVETVAHRVKVRAEEATMFIQSLAYLGREAAVQVRAAKVAGAVLDGVWETVTQQATRIYRTVTESEHVRAGSVDVRCDNVLAMHASNTTLTSKELIKMDAGQILMG